MRIVGKPLDDVTIGPAALILQRLGKIPVIEAEPGLDARREKAVDQPVIEGEARLICLPRPEGSTRGQETEKR